MKFLFPAVLCGALLSSAPAWAHKVLASVFASGDKIEGEIGFSDSSMAKEQTVEVFDAAGRKLGETKTDAQGAFVFAPTQRVEHVFRANLGAGHIAEARMSVDELPRIAAAAPDAPVAPDAAAPPQAAAAPSTDALRALIAEEVRREVKPLRQEISSYKEKNDLQAILGGIGYIIGLFGIGFYVAARRKAA